MFDTWDVPREKKLGAKKTLYTLSLKNVPTFKLSVNLSNLNQFSKILHCWNSGKRVKFATKPIGLRNSTSHLRHVATLRWEIKNSYFLQIFSRCAWTIVNVL